MKKFKQKADLKLILQSTEDQTQMLIDKIRKIFDENASILSKYYDIYKYKPENIISKEEFARGTNKLVYKVIDKDDNIYAYSTYDFIKMINDISNHIKILVYYLPNKDKYDFKIPFIYFDYTPAYVTDFIQFNKETELKTAKYTRVDLKYCKSYGQFLNFLINDLNMDPNDFETYIDKNNDIYFLDFGEFMPLLNKDKFFKEFIRLLESECEVLSEKKDECYRSLRCIVDEIRNL